MSKLRAMRHHNARPPAGRLKERSITALIVVLMAGLFAAAGIIMAYYFLGNPDILVSGGEEKQPQRKLVHLQIEDSEFLVPDYMVGSVSRTTLRRIKVINLQVPLPYEPKRQPVVFADRPDIEKWLFATIEPGTVKFGPKQWLREIYRIYIAGPAVLDQSGLYVYRFLAASPYRDIELLTDNLDKPAFIIRCELRKSTLGNRMCERQFALTGKLLVRYRFSHAQLNDWKNTHEVIQTVLKDIQNQSRPKN